MIGLQDNLKHEVRFFCIFKRNNSKIYMYICNQISTQ